MSAGTIALTNNSANVTGTGTAFTTDLKAGDFVVVIIGGVTYTLGVKAITSATALTLVTAYGGPNATGNAWTAVPNATLVGITSQVAADVAKAIRGLNLDKANWQQVFSGTGNITVTLPDGSTYTGPSWNYLANNTLSSQAAFFSGDANTITANGIYSPTATATNVPIAVTGVLEHYNRYGNSQMVQIFHSVGTSAATSNKHFIRTGSVTSGIATWTAWQPMFNGSDTIPVANGGTGAITAAAARTALGLDAIGYTLLDSEYKRGSFASGRRAKNSGGSGVWYFDNTPFGNGEQYGTCIQVSNRSDSSDAAGSGVWQHYLALGSSGNIIYAQNINGNYAAYTMRSTKNTTVDSNGFIKSASPIYRLCNTDASKPDGVENDDFVIAGYGSANGEARGVTAARISEGIYQVNGSLGLSSDGWTIEVPQDVNGNRLLFVETEVSNEGRITIKTYKRKFDVESAMIIAGDPMDIPAGRWIDLRLEMPADTDFTDTDLPENNDGKELSS